jgi:hypothetical protein
MIFNRRAFLQALGLGAIASFYPFSIGLRQRFASDPLSMQGKPEITIAPRYIYNTSYNRRLRTTVHTVSTIFRGEEYGLQWLETDRARYLRIKNDGVVYARVLLVHLNKTMKQIGAPRLLVEREIRTYERVPA